MSRLVRSCVDHGVALAVIWSVGLTLVGCEQQPLGRRIARSLPQVDMEAAGAAESIDPAVTATQDAASWKRYCSLYLLSTTVEDSKASKATEEGEKPRTTTAGSRLPETVRKYKTLHDEIPADVVKAMTEHNVRNYSVHIGLVSGDYYAVRYFEYSGSNPEVDLTLLSRHPAYRKWDEACEACQVVLLPVSASPMGPFMEEIFHKELRPDGHGSQAAPPDAEANQPTS